MPGLFLCSKVVFGHKLKDASFQPMVLSDRCQLVHVGHANVARSESHPQGTVVPQRQGSRFMIRTTTNRDLEQA